MYSSLFVTLMGMGTVFFGLICIIFLTMLMSALLKEDPSAAPQAVPAAAAPAAADRTREQETAAAIIAAVTEALGPDAARMNITNIRKI